MQLVAIASKMLSRRKWKFGWIHCAITKDANLEIFAYFAKDKLT